mmetsp:Transcript_715/g.1657  ORF Transcript_715/g.1657 Transcript_715/m.1657 type:complete len:632 (+) Transcript_715:278-2173(+)
MTTVPTLGERLDALVDRIDSIPSTQLYIAAVVTSVVFSCMLLNSGGSNGVVDPAKIPDNIGRPPSVRRKRRDGSNPEDEPEPRWHILTILNYAAVTSFTSSVLYFATDASRFLADSSSLLKFITGWSVFLCYFFGFFGISFVDADGLIAREEHEAAARQQQQRMQKQHSLGISSPPSKSKSKLHSAACSVPVSSDGASTKKRSSSSSCTPVDVKELADEKIASLVLTGQIKDHTLEKILGCDRAVTVRRLAFDCKLSTLDRGGALSDLPSGPSLDYDRVFGANCEVVVGYIPIPVGMVGPLTLNDETFFVPMSTTEGCLVASTNRGCKAISQGTGAISTVIRDGITRAPCVRMKSAKEAADLKIWCEQKDNFALLKKEFESTTSFGKLLSVSPIVAGKNVYIRLQCFSGDAMGMNMVSKGSLAVIDLLKSTFPTLELVALSGNVCCDKKSGAINWIEGRGKSVVVEATIPLEVVRSTLKTNVKTIVHVNIQKNLIGSAMASTVGGFNAHASNIVTAIFLATGQDPAQNVESSNCITLMEETDEGDLWISCTMPSIEVGTVGGGTSLPAQSACLKAIGCYGSGDTPGQNAKKLASVVAATTMAGELSLLAALASNTLVQAHMAHNRKPATSK